MAFKQQSIRMPIEYADWLEKRAGKDDESRGYIIQQAIYAMSNGNLPTPRRRDKRDD